MSATRPTASLPIFRPACATNRSEFSPQPERIAASRCFSKPAPFTRISRLSCFLRLLILFATFFLRDDDHAWTSLDAPLLRRRRRADIKEQMGY